MFLFTVATGLYEKSESLMVYIKYTLQVVGLYVVFDTELMNFIEA